MGGLSPFHWLVVILIIVLLFGSKKIPDLAKSLGQGIKEFKKASQEGEKEASALPPVSKTPTIDQKTGLPVGLEEQGAVKKEEPKA